MRVESLRTSQKECIETPILKNDPIVIPCNYGLSGWNLSAFRSGQQQAFDVCIHRLMIGENTTAIVLPTRYGKSDIIRLVALLAKSMGLVSGTIALSPGLILRDQLVNNKSLISMANRYQIDSFEAMRVRTMKDAFEQPFVNNEYLLSSTFELATRRMDRFVDIADTMLHTNGKPLLFFIDECQETSEIKKRGEFVAKLINKEARFILVTATPIRADGEVIPGFKKKILDEADARRFVVTDAGDGVHNKVDVYEGKKELVVLEADHVTTFREAWNERPSPLCHLSREIVDVDISEFDIGGNFEKIKLSDVTISQSRRYLSKAIRNDRVIEKMIELVLDQLERLKRINPKCAAIIFTGNDEGSDEEDNAHAKKVQSVIKSTEFKYGLNLDVKIATMKSDDDEKSAKIIQQFVGDDSDNGRGDILIVKQMGGRGLDVPRVKVIGDLSSIRAVAATIQRLMRAATPYNGISVATIITLADPLMSAIWKQQVSDEGGESHGEWRDSGMEITDSYLKEKEEKLQNEFVIEGADLAMYDDSHGYAGDMELRNMVEWVCNSFPDINARLTKPEIQRQLYNGKPERRLVESRLNNTKSYSIDEEINKLHEDINKMVKKLSGAYPGTTDENKLTAWRNRTKFFMNKAKRSCGVSTEIQIKRITSLKTLRLMLDALHTYKPTDVII